MTAGDAATPPPGHRPPGRPVSGRELSAQAANFEDLGDAEKVKFSQTELGSIASLLDDLLDRHAALRTEVSDPDGLVRFTLGHDGRLLELAIHEGIGQILTNTQFEELFTVLLAAGGEAVQASLDDFRREIDW